MENETLELMERLTKAEKLDVIAYDEIVDLDALEFFYGMAGARAAQIAEMEDGPDKENAAAELDIIAGFRSLYEERIAGKKDGERPSAVILGASRAE